MERQFILRLHETIKHVVDLKSSTLDVCNDKSVVLVHNGKRYPGIIVRLPCIVESQKTMDGRQHYKVADISTLVVVYPHGDFDFDKEREMHELSGLCPPLKYVKARRFRKKNSKVEYVEEIERKVNELLEKDMKAISVEVVTKEEKEDSDDLDVLAAEIENKLADHEELHQEEVQACPPEADEKKEEKPRNAEVERLEKSIEEKRKQMESALNPILQKRFESQLGVLMKELEEMKRSLEVE
ncbi:TATA-binding protein-associated factor [Encephalitozoon romaleae SJ-2008]|uniref:TATA-binding protein-associated factor n=1 Tax=Encephalitozoon romaleae (strain SJ-2008) TaxID=1178016 RepID=I7AEA8_ENCRO|nr:TATA-binding protein-associated factor [Encephalitozoon romaleae SJ-2008]AFN82985.1 TATA-binding protein-associated factor [Encephalitozoon romaleae SJ-2008]